MSKGGSLLEDVGRLLAPQTTQGFLNAPLEKQTRARALDQGNAMDQLIQGLSGKQPSQTINVSGQDEVVPPLKMSTQTMAPLPSAPTQAPGANIGSPNGNAFSGGYSPTSGLAQFMQNKMPELIMRSDPQTMIKTLQSRAIMSSYLDQIPGLTAAQRATIMANPEVGMKAYADNVAFPSIPENVRSVGILQSKIKELGPGTPEAKPYEDELGKLTTNLEAVKFGEEQRHNRATESTGALVESKDAFGNPVIINKLTGKTQTPSGIQAVGNDDVESAAQMIANYKKRPATGAAAMRPFNLAIMKRVSEINPDYNEQFYNSSNAARIKFSSGKEGALTRSANVATSHLETLSALGEALDNGDWKTANALKQRLSDEFGGVPIAGYEAAAPLVGDEVAKFILGGNSALADREKFAAPLSSARSGPSRTAAINSFRGLMVGQLHGLKRQYETETKSKDFGDKLDPDVAKLLDNPQYAPGTNPNAPQPPSGAPPEAKQASDGKWYSPDPARPGKFLLWQ